MKHETTVLHDSVLYRLIFKLGNLSIMFELFKRSVNRTIWLMINVIWYFKDSCTHICILCYLNITANILILLYDILFQYISYCVY